MKHTSIEQAKKKLFANAEKFATRLGNILGFYAAILAGWDTATAARQGNYGKTAQEFTNMLALGSMTLGSFMAQEQPWIVMLGNKGGIPTTVIKRNGLQLLRFGGVISLGFFAWDILKTIKGDNPMQEMFLGIWNGNIKTNPVTALYIKNKKYAAIKKLLDEIEKLAMGTFEVYWSYLNWRAVVPLYEMEVNPEVIKKWVQINTVSKLPSKEDLAQRDFWQKWFYLNIEKNPPQMQVDEIIQFYDLCQNAAEGQFFPSRFSYRQVAQWLRAGEFIPSTTQPEDSRWDHPLYRIPKSRKGLHNLRDGQEFSG